MSFSVGWDRYELDLGKSGSPWLISTCTEKRVVGLLGRGRMGMGYRLAIHFPLFPLNGPEPGSYDRLRRHSIWAGVDGANVFLPPQDVLTQNCNVFGALGYGKTTGSSI